MTRQKRLQGRLEVLKFDQHCESNLNTDIKATELSVRITGVCVTVRPHKVHQKSVFALRKGLSL